MKIVALMFALSFLLSGCTLMLGAKVKVKEDEDYKVKVKVKEDYKVKVKVKVKED